MKFRWFEIQTAGIRGKKYVSHQQEDEGVGAGFSKSFWEKNFYFFYSCKDKIK